MYPVADHDRRPPQLTGSHSLWNERVSYALRTAVAALAALYAAMWMELDVPRWALFTVVVVSPPGQGPIVRKTVARAIGTPIGCVAAVLLAGLFPQDRVGYVLGLGVWIGVCGYWATRSLGYVAYGAVLAGFTAAIVAGDAANQPDQVFWKAIYRGSATIVGILFALLAAALENRSDDAPGDLADRVCNVAGRLLDWACERLRPGAAAGDDAPFAAPALDLETAVLDAFAERPALRRVRPWVAGLPTALLSIQSATLELSRHAGNEDADNARAIAFEISHYCACAV